MTTADTSAIKSKHAVTITKWDGDTDAEPYATVQIVQYQDAAGNVIDDLPTIEAWEAAQKGTDHATD